MITTAVLATGAFRQSRLRAAKATSSANQHVELGRFFLNKVTPADTVTAIEHFQAATKEDPDFAPAYAGLADAYNQQAGVFIAAEPPTNVRLPALRAATRGIQLDPTLAEAYTALGYTTLHELDWATAGKALRRAIELNPRYTRAHLTYASYLASQRQFKEAIAEARQALEIEPASLRVRQVLAWMLYFDRQYEAAIHELHTLVEMDRTFSQAQFHLGEALLVAGRFEEAIPTLQKVVDETSGAPAPFGLLAMAYAGAHQREQAQSIVEDLERRAKTGYVPPGALLLAYIAVGDKQRAIDMLERGYRERDNYEIWIDASPLMDSLRDEPRYQALCRQVMLGTTARTSEQRIASDSCAERRERINPAGAQGRSGRGRQSGGKE
jgi:tetratricopeptide (TPR) repeat protein